MRDRLTAVFAGVSALLALAVLCSPAGAQTPQVRLAAATDCRDNVNCIPGFKRVYGIDPTTVYSSLTVADAGIQALDDGIAEVAVAFSSNPQLSRPDILTLADDKRMIGDDHIVPVLRAATLRRYGRPLRRRLNAASAILSTLELRGLNQQVIDGRLPVAVGGEFADANALGGPAAHRRRGPRIRIGFQPFDENETLAHFYAAALRGAGFRVSVRESGLRPATVRAMRRKRIDMWPGYDGSLRAFLGARRLKTGLKRIGAKPLKRSPAEDRNGFAMKLETARALGIAKLSDLTRYWPAATASRRLAQGTVGAEGGEPRQHEQWAVAPGSLLDLPGAWQLTQGAGVTVAIVDSGARLDHTDLAPNVWTNFDEIPGNGVDDDHNGYVDDVHGVDLTSKRGGQDLHDAYGHGTHVAGIVAAARNGRGVVGVAPRAKLMIVKALADNGAGTTGGAAEGIRYAADNGARIINLSLGGDTPDKRLDEAIKVAEAAGALVVCSAGNDGRDIDDKPSYPAAIPAQNLLAVASTDPDSGKGISSYSNFGRFAVQVAAPGAGILSASRDGTWEVMSGTSMASPMVAGVAALAASVNPRISPVDLRAIIMQSSSRARLPVAAGYVDALRTVLAASHASGYDTTQKPRLRILEAVRSGGRVRVQAAVLGSTASIRRYQVRLGRGRPVGLASRRTPFKVTIPRAGGRVRVSALNGAGKPVASAQRKVQRLRKGKGGVGTGGGVGA
jgi:glycine betaine/choline ABC-type transport system substrate-binding protein